MWVEFYAALLLILMDRALCLCFILGWVCFPISYTYLHFVLYCVAFTYDKLMGILDVSRHVLQKVAVGCFLIVLKVFMRGEPFRFESFCG